MLPNTDKNNNTIYETAVLNEQAEAMLTKVAKNAHEVKHQLVLHMMQANMYKENYMPNRNNSMDASVLEIRDVSRTEPISNLYMMLHELDYHMGVRFTADEMERVQTIEKINKK